jgi:hypothetical protein
MTTDDFFDDVQRDSERRKADPLPFALEALEDLFAHRDDVEEGFRRFQGKLEAFFWWADDAVQCLELVLADPPPDLGKVVREQAGVVIWLTDGGLHQADAAQTETWLRETCVPRLRSMFDAYVAEQTAAQVRAREDAAEA